jgi:hypothetical protein
MEILSPPRSGRQPDVRTPSWTESPTDEEVAEASVLLAEVGLLKERGLTAEAIVADFVFKNIQPLKDRVHPAYLYQGLADPTRVINKKIPSADLVSRLEMILRGKVSNVGAPIAYSAWNLPPAKAFTLFVSNPPAIDGNLGFRTRPSDEEINALVASLGKIPDDERQVYFEVPVDPNDAEMNAMLDMLAEDSSDATPAETLAVAPLPDAGITLNVQRPVRVRSRRPCRVNQADLPVDGQKKKRRRLRRVSSLDQDAGPSGPAAEEVPVPEFTNADPNGCSMPVADPNGCGASVADEDEEENEVPLTRKNSRQFLASGGSSGVPSPALSALVGLQNISLADFDQTLEDMVPEDLLSGPVDDDVAEACGAVPDAGLRSSRASSTLERGLEGRDADLDCPDFMEVTEGPSTLEVVTAESLDLETGADTCSAPEGVVGDDLAQAKGASHCPAPEGAAGDDPAQVGSASYNPAPEGAQTGTPSGTSMDVHAGSPPHSGCMVVAQTLDQGVALEGSVPADRVSGSGKGAELIPVVPLQAASGDDLVPGYPLISPDLGIPSFFSNLQVLCCFLA